MKTLAALALCVLAVGLPAPASAGVPTDQLKESVDKVLTILRDPALTGPAKARARRIAIGEVVDTAFDFGAMTQAALAVHWRARAPEERAEFTRLFKELVERSYINLLERRGGYSGEKVIYVGETGSGDYARVKTKIITKRDEEIPVDYAMRHEGRAWLIYDVFIENVSLIANYRAQFNSVITTSSYEELVKRVRSRVTELEQEEESRAKENERSR
jgi:phospholipid transport system substrate-binding protein